MTTMQRRGYMVHRWPYQPVIIITATAPVYMQPHVYERIDDDAFEAFMTAWHAGDYAQTQIVLGEPDPRDGLAHLAEANERELSARLREHGLTVAADFFESVKPVEARQHAVPTGEPPKRWQPCADCLTPITCGEADELPCP